MRYVMKMGIDDREVAAALIDLGVHGEIAMREVDGGLFRSDKRTIGLKTVASSTASPEGFAMLGALLERMSLAPDTVEVFEPLEQPQLGIDRSRLFGRRRRGWRWRRRRLVIRPDGEEPWSARDNRHRATARSPASRQDESSARSRPR